LSPQVPRRKLRIKQSSESNVDGTEEDNSVIKLVENKYNNATNETTNKNKIVKCYECDDNGIPIKQIFPSNNATNPFNNSKVPYIAPNNTDNDVNKKPSHKKPYSQPKPTPAPTIPIQNDSVPPCNLPDIDWENRPIMESEECSYTQIFDNLLLLCVEKECLPNLIDYRKYHNYK
jgi:hypothetical protein